MEIDSVLPAMPCHYMLNQNLVEIHLVKNILIAYVDDVQTTFLQESSVSYYMNILLPTQYMS